MVSGNGERNYRSVIIREVAMPPVCYNSLTDILQGGKEGLLMTIHSELIAGHYTTTGRDQRKELNG